MIRILKTPIHNRVRLVSVSLALSLPLRFSLRPRRLAKRKPEMKRRARYLAITAAWQLA